MKQCTKCKESKTTDNFYKSRAAKDGLQSWCKPCVRIASHKNVEPDWESYKVCSRCKQSRRADNYYRSSTTKDGLGSACKHCIESTRRNTPKKKKEGEDEMLEILGTNFTIEPYERGTNERLDALLSPDELVWIVNGRRGRYPISAPTREAAQEKYIAVSTQQF